MKDRWGEKKKEVDYLQEQLRFSYQTIKDLETSLDVSEIHLDRIRSALDLDPFCSITEVIETIHALKNYISGKR